MMAENPLVKTKDDERILAELLKLRNEHKYSFGTILNSEKFRRFREWLDEKAPLLQDGKYTAVTKLYWVEHGLTDFPTCGFCGKTKLIRNIDSFERGYFRACSQKCDGMKAVKKEKYKATSLKRWGSENFYSSDAGKDARKKWCEANGVSNSFQLESVKEKSRKTRRKRFGYDYTMQSPEKRALASERYKAKTGYSHQFENPEVVAKARHTADEKKKAGVDIYEKRRLGNRMRRYAEFARCREIRPMFAEADFTRLDARLQYIVPLKWKCLKCGNEFEELLDQNWSSRMHMPARCPVCHPLDASVGTSEAEREFAGFCGTCTEIIENDRTVIAPFELDVFIPSKKLAFEFDGLYWHCDGVKPAKYHLAKTELCAEKDIRLVHLFENEWAEKRQIVESRVRDMLGVYSQIVYARKCELRETGKDEARLFQDANHLQGAVESSVRLGLYFENELVALMTFGKCRFDKTHEWEMLRFCCKLGYHIPGAAGKLLKHFERVYRPKSLVTYADRRWSTGNLYRVLGFRFIRNSPPNYWYFKNPSLRLESRVKYQKHRLKDLLPNFDESKTEVENMKANGYSRIFDCGNMVFVKEYGDKGVQGS